MAHKSLPSAPNPEDESLIENPNPARCPRGLVQSEILPRLKNARQESLIHCSITKQHCLITKQHCSISEIVNCFAQKSFTINHRAVPSPELTCLIAKQHCLITNPHCFFVKPHWFVTKTLCSVTVKPISGTGQPCFLPETLTSIGQILASVTDSIISEAHQL